MKNTNNKSITIPVCIWDGCSLENENNENVGSADFSGW